MGLYTHAKKIQMVREDLKHIMLRSGELHIQMADLKTIGSYIARFTLYQEGFLNGQEENGECRGQLLALAKDLGNARTEGKRGKVENVHKALDEKVESLEIMSKLDEFDKEHANTPMFQVFYQYKTMVLEMMMFVRAVRTADWLLHLQAIEKFTKYYFSQALEKEFLDGNWVVNKNPSVSFCGLGADNGLEHINRSMKVSGGLVGITFNPSALAKFFLKAPDLARLAEQAKDMAALSDLLKLSRFHFHRLGAMMTRGKASKEDAYSITNKMPERLKMPEPLSAVDDHVILVNDSTDIDEMRSVACQTEDLLASRVEDEENCGHRYNDTSTAELSQIKLEFCEIKNLLLSVVEDNRLMRRRLDMQEQREPDASASARVSRIDDPSSRSSIMPRPSTPASNSNHESSPSMTASTSASTSNHESLPPGS
ncbi:predicted protein [Nematostella vectensis]|uniref:Uncharacterized protein n=1 Tax=Nematostella vectensis TaxID=45351 RepID=A7SB11_NEMVE|nr:predicted protein [Nematostella vectensis]|eukprot:XP_001631161.1 predicted protein [Nematostella vectensis]